MKFMTGLGTVMLVLSAAVALAAPPEPPKRLTPEDMGKLCEGGDRDMCVNAAQTLSYPDGGLLDSENLMKAQEYAEKACELKASEGCSTLFFVKLQREALKKSRLH